LPPEQNPFQEDPEVLHQVGNLSRQLTLQITFCWRQRELNQTKKNTLEQYSRQEKRDGNKPVDKKATPPHSSEPLLEMCTFHRSELSNRISSPFSSKKRSERGRKESKGGVLVSLLCVRTFPPCLSSVHSDLKKCISSVFPG